VAEPYGFTQKEQDSESGLHYFETRYLAGHLGRFLQFDPLSAGVTAERLANPQQAHPYAYGGNNPLARVDPLGLDDEEEESPLSLTWRAIKADVSQTIEGVAEKADAIRADPIGEGLPLAADLAVGLSPMAPLMTAASGVVNVGEAATGYEIDTQRGQIVEMNDDQRLGKVQGALFKLSATAGTVAGGMVANARLAAANAEMALEGARATAAKAARAAAEFDPKAANIAVNQSVPEAFGKTMARPGPLLIDPKAPGPSYKATLPGSPEAASRRADQWCDYVARRLRETQAERHRLLDTTGTAVSVLKRIFAEANRIYGHPILPGDY
jgi:RHS repeat-associated protein